MKETDLKKLTDEGLLARTNELVAQERKLLTDLLWHLKEIEERRLHLFRGFPSLFEYCTKALGYSEGAAARRIQAMRLLRELPELEKPIAEGTLNLSHLTSFHHFLKREKKDHQKTYTGKEKAELLAQLKSTSKREAEKFFATLSPILVPNEQTRVVSRSLTEVKFTLNDEQLRKFTRLKEIYSHVNPEMGFAELFERLADEVLTKLEMRQVKGSEKSANQIQANPRVTKVTPPVELKTTLATPAAGSAFLPASMPRSGTKTRVRTKSSESRPSSRYIPRSQQIPIDQCTYQDPITKRVCGARFRLERDHIRPFGKGGSHHRQNLRTLCKQHNLLLAVQSYGEKKMAYYLKR